MTELQNKNHYANIDGLKSFAAIGIILMHIRANSQYDITGFLYNDLVPFFNEFVFLFMVISAFGICCGYYDKFIGGKISIVDFYKKRYVKILPFFAVLVLIDLFRERSVSALIESFADITLVFGLLPNANISVIGVGWFLGIVFVFYMVFPFFVFLMENKYRAWIAFIVSIIYNIVCDFYFFDTNHVLVSQVKTYNFLYSSMFFVAGCLIYVYRSSIISFISKYKICVISVCILVFALYFIANDLREM